LKIIFITNNQTAFFYSRSKLSVMLTW